MAKQNPELYLRDVAVTLYNRGLLIQSERRVTESRADYNEVIAIYGKLAQGSESTYAQVIARVEASLAELGEK